MRRSDGPVRQTPIFTPNRDTRIRGTIPTQGQRAQLHCLIKHTKFGPTHLVTSCRACPCNVPGPPKAHPCGRLIVHTRRPWTPGTSQPGDFFELDRAILGSSQPAPAVYKRNEKLPYIYTIYSILFDYIILCYIRL